MADRVNASIRLGGTLTQDLLARFIAIIVDEGLSTDWDAAGFDEDDIPENEPLELVARDVAWGRFVQLEAFCVAQGLLFASWCEGFSGSWEAERVVFDGTSEPRSYLVTGSDTLVLPFPEIRALGTLEAIEGHFRTANVTIPPLRVRSDEPDTSDGPTAAMWRALASFRARHGRYWKRALTDLWMNGGDLDEPCGAALRNVRNRLGPVWLYRLRPGQLDAAISRIAAEGDAPRPGSEEGRR